MIKVLVVDDHPVVREGIKAVLGWAEDIRVVGEAGNSNDALALVNEHRPDVVLLDMLMPGSSGGVVVRRIKSASQSTKVVVLTSFKDEEYLFSALDAGADAYLLKNAPMNDMAETIRSVDTGQKILSPELVGKLVGRYQEYSGRLAVEERIVSDFEAKVLELLATGASNKEIGDLMFVSESTVKRKVQELCQKLEVEDRIQLVVKAINKGLI